MSENNVTRQVRFVCHDYEHFPDIAIERLPCGKPVVSFGGMDEARDLEPLEAIVIGTALVEAGKEAHPDWLLHHTRIDTPSQNQSGTPETTGDNTPPAPAPRQGNTCSGH